MVNFVLAGHDFGYEVQTAIQIFFPNRHYYPAVSVPPEGMVVKSVYTENSAEACLFIDGAPVAESVLDHSADISEKDKKHIIKEAVFNVLSKFTGYTPKWGMITGVRPAKTASELSAEGLSDREILEYFTGRFRVSEDKAALALKVSRAEKEILEENRPEDMSIYIGIPFCPTRCLYCSFTSYPIDRYAKKADEYIAALSRELRFIAENIKGRRIRSLYIGGGTPTSLSENQFEALIDSVCGNFDTESVEEFTVEAGRPDTITPNKLKAMRKAGVSRISVNPQTMNQKTLDIIGRRHSVEDIKNAFYMARAEGFENINMDLILGLPEEGIEDVENTMLEIESLSPESITVHTLAVKRASRLKENIFSYDLAAADDMDKMINLAAGYAEKMGLEPYYMYRQKAMLGNFENVGYCRRGCQSIYNIEIMEEKQTVIAAGAGGATKLYDPVKNELVRVFNVKSVEDYLARLDEMLVRKVKAFSLNRW
ncbi:coproporphyrinogen dehydrogenase HemZ [Lachnospiraceae bacterium NSJ-143]|nr:coproporphyrinogen dehydrogenase HemZ [Lachnospiraceae bacterium NSJ-143]